MKADLEPPLRFAVAGATNAIEYIDRLPRLEGHDHIASAIMAFEAAIEHLRAHAEKADIDLRESMQT